MSHGEPLVSQQREEAKGDVAIEVDRLFRQRASRLIAVLAHRFGIHQIELIEDAVQEAFVKALRTWPYRGEPDRPVAWLTSVAKNSILDQLRRRGRWTEKSQLVQQEVQLSTEPKEPTLGNEPSDQRLRMILATCHPSLSVDSQVALTLKLVGGFAVTEIATAFLTSESTIAQRLVRAKRLLRDQRIELEIPSGNELTRRLESVCEVLYLMFNEGYSCSRGESLVRRELCDEASRLCRALISHPRSNQPDAHALAALFCFQSARLDARTDGRGRLIPLPQQDRATWDRRYIAQGLAHLERAASGRSCSPFHLEAEIAACHVTAESFAATDWQRILECYEQLLELHPSPVVALNRAIALAEAYDPTDGLVELDSLRSQHRLENYAPYHVAHGELLRRVGEHHKAIAAFQRAFELTESQPIRNFLESKLVDARPN